MKRWREGEVEALRKYAYRGAPSRFGGEQRARSRELMTHNAEAYVVERGVGL